MAEDKPHNTNEHDWLSEPQHDHDHHGCGHSLHDYEEEVAPPEMDPATRSLSEALQISFRLLAVVMVVVLVFFLLTGVQSIKQSELGIVKVFGRDIRVENPGLAYNWPFPVGEIEIIPVQEESISVDEFWMYETPGDLALDLLERSAPPGGLRPKWDGALITGDRNLLHVKLTCKYRVKDPILYRKSLRDAKEALRCVVEDAAIRSAAQRTADGILGPEQNEFLKDVRELSQQKISLLMGITDPLSQGEGIEIVNVLMENKTVPLRALQAYQLAQYARTEAQKKINTAQAEAERILNESAGDNYRVLVGAPYEGVSSEWDIQDLVADGQEYDLIGQYNSARQQGDNEQAEKLLHRIEALLLSTATSGESSRILAEARADKTDTIEMAKSRYLRFAQLLSEYEKSPEFFLQRYWAEAREDILDGPLTEKIYITEGDQKTVLRINRDPDIAREIKREALQQKNVQSVGERRRL